MLAAAPFLAAPFLAPTFLDFLEAGCFEVPASAFLFLHNSNVIKSLCKANARGKKGQQELQLTLIWQQMKVVIQHQVQ